MRHLTQISTRKSPSLVYHIVLYAFTEIALGSILNDASAKMRAGSCDIS